MKLNEKQKILLSVVVFAVLLGGLLTLNYFKYKGRKALQAKMADYAKQEKLANEKIRQIPELREKRAKLAEIIDQYASILPREEHIQHEAFAETVDGYSRETNVVIQKVESVDDAGDGGEESKGKKDENFIRHRYRLQLVGEFPDFLRFVNKIENHTRFLKVDEIFIRPLGVDRSLSGNGKDDAAVLDLAKVKFKNIELLVSTYTYKKD